MLNSCGISRKQIKELATELGLVIRDSHKFDPAVFLAAFCLQSQVDSPSYNDLAAKIEATYGISTSKQALWKRVNDSCVLFFQAILALMIKHRYSQDPIKLAFTANYYQRILIQDSTIIKVPKKLFQIFSGVTNRYNTVCNIRIQGVYELISGRFIDFSVDSYSKNDLLSAPELQISKADLVLRDRGYCSFSEIQRHVSHGADCVYRHKMKFVYLDVESGKPIDLMKLLREKEYIDRIVCLNNPERTKVRLMAGPVKEQIANARRRKAKKEIKGHNPSRELLELMGYTVFITTIMDPRIDLEQIIKIYSLRWKIEIIFKIWKSHLSFDKIHNVSFNQLWLILLSRFMMILLITHLLYIQYLNKIQKHSGKYLSMMKFIKYINKNPVLISLLLKASKKKNSSICALLDTLARYCAYDKRKRLNILDLQFQVFLS